MTSADSDRKPSRGAIKLVYLVPLGFFLALALVFLMRLESGIDVASIPSALIGQPAPEFDLPLLEGIGVPGLKRADLDGQVTVVNIFASWCGPCRLEHPILERLAKDGRFRVVGINYKDRPKDALRFLNELGNPYVAVGVDEKGRTSIDWGVYGVPETFVIDRAGIIRYKFIGPLNDDTADRLLMPKIEAALTAKATS